MRLPLRISTRNIDGTPIQGSGSNTYNPGFIVGLNSSFGFNSSPHVFELETVREDFTPDLTLLPEIGEDVQLSFADDTFKIWGIVTHKEYSQSMSGTVHSLRVEDKRRLLDSIAVFTEDTGDQIVGVNALSVGRELRLLDHSYKTLDDIIVFGASYRQIYQAIENAALSIGTISLLSIFPTPEHVQSLLYVGAGGSAEVTLNNFKWKYSGQNLRDVVSGIFDDLGLDWYWEMASNTIKLIKRSNVFTIEPENIPIPNDPAEIISVRYGGDDTKQNQQFLLLGAQQEGFIDGGLLSDLDGLSTPSGVVWLPAWNNLTIKFTDENGNFVYYSPTEKELQISLTSIELWSYFKKYQTLWGTTDAGYTIAQSSSFQSRIDTLVGSSDTAAPNASGIYYIENRRNRDQNWIIAWYEKVRSLASTHLGRTYYAENVLLSDDYGKFELNEDSWCGIENEHQLNELGQPTDIISEELDYVAPFVKNDFKVGAHLKLPGNTLYGADGNAAPSDFDEWNETLSDDGVTITNHYIPVSIQEVKTEPINPRGTTNPFDAYPVGTLICTLPALASQSFVVDTILDQIENIQFQAATSNQTLFDVLIGSKLPVPFANLNGRVAIPVKSAKRYGSNYPSEWVSVNSDNRKVEVIIDERFAPWTFAFTGTTGESSVDTLDVLAKSFISMKSANASEAVFADVEKTGLPAISFDQIADGQGNLVTGITSLSMRFGMNGFTTSYSLKSHYDEFGIEAKLGELTRNRIKGSIHPLNYTFLANVPKGKTVPPIPAVAKRDGFASALFIINPDEPVVTKSVIIQRIEYAGGVPGITNEIYAADVLTSTDGGVSYQNSGGVVPPGFLSNHEMAPCRDGYLDIGDIAYYTYGRISGVKVSYFTGGRTLVGGFLAKASTETYNQIINGTEMPYADFRLSRNSANPANSSHIDFIGVPLQEGETVVLDKFYDVSVKPSYNQGKYLQSSADLQVFIQNLLPNIPSGGEATPVKVISITQPNPSLSEDGYAKVTVRPTFDSDPLTDPDLNETDVRVMGFEGNIDLTNAFPVNTPGLLAVDRDGNKYFWHNQIAFI